MSAKTMTVTAAGDREIIITRVFDAPRRRVFDAYTKPELLRRWLGGLPGWEMSVCEADLRVGGAYRYAWRHPEQGEMGMGGTYREVVPGERLVATEKFDQPWYPGEGLVTTVFTEDGGKTTITTTLRYESTQARDGVMQSPMETGMEGSYDRLADLLAEAA